MFFVLENIFSNDLDLAAYPGFAYLDPMPGRDRDRPLYAPPGSLRNGNGITPWQNLRQNAALQMNMNKQFYPPTHIIGPMRPPEAAQQKFSQLFSNRPTINVEKARSYPVMVLTEIFPELKINWVEGVGRGDRQFKVEAEVQGRSFFGEVEFLVLPCS